MTRPYVAVDIVLLPPARVSRRAVALSRRLASDIVLGPGALPHITLAMACVRRDALPELGAALRDLAARTPAFEVTLEGAIAHRSGPHVTAWYVARRTRALAALHRECMALLDPHRRRVVPSDAFASRRGGRIADSSRRWVRRFAQDAAFARYAPHVTLGRGDPGVDPALPLSFPARRLALCHLGNHCTCARVLHEARLSPSGVN